MSGVETIFGLVASGAGLASLSIQLVESAQKLNNIYQSAKDAPRTVSRLVFRLETMAMALRQLERQRIDKNPNEDLLSRCILECQQSTAEIKQLVDKMAARLTAYTRIGKLYTAFRQNDLRNLLDDLEQAKSSLELAYMLYLAEDRVRRDQAQREILDSLEAQISAGTTGLSRQMALLANHPTSMHQHNQKLSSYTLVTAEPNAIPTQEADQENRSSTINDLRQLKHTARTDSRRRDTKTSFHASFRLPTWLSRRIFDVSISQAQCRWSMYLRTYNVTSRDSLIFLFCRNGNLTGVQRLIELGEATTLDVRHDYLKGGVGGWWTLLDEAAENGNLEICRYLLTQATWPDHGAVLSNALGWLSRPGTMQTPEEGYRLFMRDPEFDADLCQHTRYKWLYYCTDQESLEVVLQNQFSGFDTQSCSARFGLAVGLAFSTSLSSFVRTIGLVMSDPRFPLLKIATGMTVLHHVAERIWTMSSSGRTEWVEFGVNLLNNGADPFSIAEVEFDDWIYYGEGYNEIIDYPRRRFAGYKHGKWLATPLLKALDKTPGWLLHGAAASELPGVVATLRTWAKMMQRAGYDLCEFGAKENEIWQSLGIFEGPMNDKRVAELGQGWRVHRLIYGAEPIDWSIEMSYYWTLSTYKLQPTPGTFIKQDRVPDKIAWFPTPDEENEGPWTLSHTKGFVDRPLDLRNWKQYGGEPVVAVVDDVQDDSGIIMLMQSRASHAPQTRRRSDSQPPMLNRREEAYCSRQRSHYHHRWLQGYHVCPADLRLKIGCTGKQYREVSDHDQKLWGDEWIDEIQTRDCLKGLSLGISWVQESGEWRDYSFLGEITAYQDKDFRRWKRNGKTIIPEWLTRCGNLRVDKLNVPESLRDGHPKRRFAHQDNLVEGVDMTPRA